MLSSRRKSAGHPQALQLKIPKSISHSATFDIKLLPILFSKKEIKNSQSYFSAKFSTSLRLGVVVRLLRFFFLSSEGGWTLFFFAPLQPAPYPQGSFFSCISSFGGKFAGNHKNWYDDVTFYISLQRSAPPPSIYFRPWENASGKDLTTVDF